MGNSQWFQHPGSGIPGARQRVCPAVYPVAQVARIHPPVLRITASLDPRWNLQSDSTDKRLPAWQTTPKAFAYQTHGEEP